MTELLVFACAALFVIWNPVSPSDTCSMSIYDAFCSGLVDLRQVSTLLAVVSPGHSLARTGRIRGPLMVFLLFLAITVSKLLVTGRRMAHARTIHLVPRSSDLL